MIIIVVHPPTHPPTHPAHSLTRNSPKTATSAFNDGCGYLEDVWNVSGRSNKIEWYLDYVWKVPAEGVWKVFGRCLEGVWNVSGRCWEVSGGCQEGVLKNAHMVKKYQDVSSIRKCR